MPQWHSSGVFPFSLTLNAFKQASPSLGDFELENWDT